MPFNLFGIQTASAVNAKSMGLKGDGITDDSTTFQALLNKYKRIYLPSGEYIISKTIVVPDDVALFGDGDNSVIKLKSSYTLTEYPWRNEDGHRSKAPYLYVGANCRLGDFVVEGDTTSAKDQDQVGILIHGDGSICQNVSTKNINYYPNEFIEGARGVCGYGECTHYCPGFGIFIFGANNVSIIGGKFEGNGYQGIGAEDANNVTIRGCYVGDGNRTGIQIHRNVNQAIIDECVVDNECVNKQADITVHGIITGYVKGLIISNCILKPALARTAAIQTVFGCEQDVIIKGCVIKSSSKGIFIFNVTNYEYASQVVTKNICIANNVIEAGEEAVMINGDYACVTNNIIEYGDSNAIVISGAHKEISGNVLTAIN